MAEVEEVTLDEIREQVTTALAEEGLTWDELKSSIGRCGCCPEDLPANANYERCRHIWQMFKRVM